MSDENKADALANSLALRQLIRAARTAAMATALPPDGHPYGSLAEVAFGTDGAPVVLISTLAEHTKALAADARASLLIDATGGRDEPLTGPRLTLVGRFARTEDAGLRARYLRRFPHAEMYAGFRDFAFWRMSVERAHLVAGFGRIRWIAPAELYDAAPLDPAIEADLLERLNVGRPVGSAVVGADGDGLDLRIDGRLSRLDFAAPAGDGDAVLAAVKATAA